MASKQSLREKTQKLKAVSDDMTEEIAKHKEELSSLQQTISRCDIELSLIRDAFGLRFGTISDAQRNQALEAMANFTEVENLQTVLQREQSQVKWLQGEVNRLQGLVPAKMLEDVDLQNLENKKQQLEEKFEALKKRNAKKEKSIKSAENKIKATLSEIDKLREDLEIKEEESKEANQIFEQAEQLASENAELTEIFINENQQMKEVQDSLSKANNEIQQIQKYIDENGNIIKETAQYQDDLDDLRQKMEKANQPLIDLKNKYESFITGINPLQENMSNQLDEITKLIEKIQGLNC
ncbi:hypothetical protein M9Y10_011735 [Tritrichomonas musculus]|uniref:Chromosome partition protein Smc n=1 Tax=Tritrichomonas musculus TaxID=1915356 RepID=A0ABR2IK57_9EUKA